MDATRALRQLGGAARWTQLIDLGVGRASLAAAVVRGDVLRPHFGTYALPGTEEPAVLAAAFHASLTCVSLCQANGLPLFARPSRVHLLVPEWRGLSANDSRPTGRVTMHRSDDSWTETETKPLAVAVDLASKCVNRYAQLALVDAALRADKLFPGEIRDFRHTPAAQRRWLIDRCDRDAHSMMESYARAWLMDAGFWVRAQVVVGGEGHRDLLVEGSVIVELDGWETHGDKRQFGNDRRRDRAAVHDGKVTLRYIYDDLFGRHRADLVADVEAALRLLRRSA